MSRKLDLLFYNGLVRTMENEAHTAQAVGIYEGRIVFVGANQEADEFEATERIDLDGALLLPGFEDSHLHMLHYGFLESVVKLFDCTSVQDVMAALKQVDHQALGWVYGRGWNETYFADQRYPHRRDLDAVFPDLPAAVVRVCGHVAVLNSVALAQIAKLPAYSQLKQDIDLETGLVKETAVMLFYEILAAPSQEYTEKLITLAAKRLNEAGITAVQSDDLNALPGCDWQRVLASFEALAEREELTVRLYEQCLFTAQPTYAEFLASGRTTGWRRGLFEIGPLKLLMDGSLGARTAALNEPYEGTEETGMVLFTQEQLNQMVRLAHNHDMQVATHGIGDRAMEMILAAYRQIQQEHPKADCRHGIVHAQITNQRILAAMKELDVMAYIQPVFVANDLDVVEERVGRQRLAGIYAWRTMRELGIRTAGGSDAPVEPFSILDNIYYAVTRAKKSGEPPGGWLPDEKLDIFDAVKLFTSDCAWAAFAENERGTVTPGKAADLVVLTEDIFQLDPEKIPAVSVRYTVVNGKIVYENHK